MSGVRQEGVLLVDDVGASGAGAAVDIVSPIGQKLMAASISVAIASNQTAIPVTGTVTVNEPVTVDAVDLDIRNLVFVTDKVDASGSSVSVTNFPATQPISAVALPLPTGATTAAAQTTQTNLLSSIDVSASDTELQVSVLNTTLTPVLLTDDVVNPSIARIAAFNLLYDGATWDRARGDAVNGALVDLGANNDVVVTKTDLTPSAPTSINVGVASALIINAQATRKGLILRNLSNNIISLGFGQAAVLNAGVTLYPRDIFQMGEYDFDTALVNAIASVAASPLAVQEYLT